MAEKLHIDLPQRIFIVALVSTDRKISKKQGIFFFFFGN